MTKKNESLLGLVPYTPTAGTNTGLVPFAPNQALTREEQRIVDEWHRQTLIIDATTTKTLLGLDKITEIHFHAATTFGEASGQILALRETAQGKEHQAYMDEFCRHQVQVLARHLLGAVEVGATNIGHEIHRSLYLAPEEDKRSFLQRLLGT